jgi:hypothetical protein
MTTAATGEVVADRGGRVLALRPMHTPRTWRFSSRLDAGRRGAFIGRRELLTEFDRALRGGERRIFLVHGRSGFGKTMLLREFSRRAQEPGRAVIELDGRSDIRLDEQLHREVHRLGLDRGFAAADLALSPQLAAMSGPVIVIDDADDVEERMRVDLLPELPASVLLVMATTAPPSPEWEIDPGWRGLVHFVPLQPFSGDEALELLDQVGLEAAHQPQLSRLAEGHPLTLSLLGRHWSTEGHGYLADLDLVDSLLARLVGAPPDRLCADGLFICAHAAVVSEDLLRFALGEPDVTTVWNWLSSLGVVQREAFGLRLNEPTRQLVETHLLHRSPGRCQTLHEAIHQHALIGVLEHPQALGPCLGLVSNLFAGHDRSSLSRIWRAPETAGRWSRGGQPDDHPRVIELIERAAGASEAALARVWLAEQPRCLYLVECDGEVCAVAMTVEVGTAAAQHCQDPVVAEAVRGLEAAGLMRTGDTAHILRFVTDAGGLRDTALATYVGVVSAVATWLTAGCSLGLAIGPFGRRWQQVLTDLALTPLRLGDGTHRQLYHFDFRRFSPEEWFDFLVQHDMCGAFGPPPRAVRPVPLGYAQFAESVQEALRNLHHVDKLAENPLAETSLVSSSDGPRGEVLQQRLLLAVHSLGGSEKDQVLTQVLEATYLRIATSQKAAAKLVDLPFSTYRRYLGRGVQRLVDLLWAAELA